MAASAGAGAPQGLLLTPRPGGTQVTASLPYAPYPLMFEWPAISLFPRRISIRPAHVDVTEARLRQGYAKLRSEDVQSDEWRARYRAAEQEARRGRRGVWADATGLLWQAVAAGAYRQAEGGGYQKAPTSSCRRTCCGFRRTRSRASR